MESHSHSEVNVKAFLKTKQLLCFNIWENIHQQSILWYKTIHTSSLFCDTRQYTQALCSYLIFHNKFCYFKQILCQEISFHFTSQEILNINKHSMVRFIKSLVWPSSQWKLKWYLCLPCWNLPRWGYVYWTWHKLNWLKNTNFSKH